jgi:hypothetical protein
LSIGENIDTGQKLQMLLIIVPVFWNKKKCEVSDVAEIFKKI